MKSFIALALLSICWAAPGHAGIMDAKPGATHASCKLPDGTVFEASAMNGSSRVVCPAPSRIQIHAAAQAVAVRQTVSATPAASVPPAVPKPAPKAVPSTRASAQARNADGIARWEHYGADPAYRSHAEALAHAEQDFIRAGWSRDVSAKMVAKMRSEPCERIELRNGDRLDFMRTGRNGQWRNVLVAFTEPYHMKLTAPACRWTLTQDGLTYEAIEPDVCHNLAGRKRGILKVAINCVYATYETRDVHEVGVRYGTYKRHDDECLGYRTVASANEADGPGAVWLKPPEGCDKCSLTGANAIVGRQPARMGVIPAKPGYTQVRLSPDEWLALCVKYIDRRGLVSSFMPVLRPATDSRSDYVMDNGVAHARVIYQSAELPQGVGVTSEKARFFWASTDEDAKALYQSFAAR